MEISCIICSDLFTHSSDVVLNNCGHMFHHTCLLQWLERSKSCPQCRCKSTERSLYKVFFNFVNTDHIKDDVGTLQFKLDNAKFKIQTLEKKLREQTEVADSKEAQNLQLKELVSNHEKKMRSYDSLVNGLKEKLGVYKVRAAEAERLQSEVVNLQSILDNVEKVQTAIHGSRAEVTEILRNETNLEVLALLTASMKKSLMVEERKSSNLHKQLKITQNELLKYKRDYNNLDSTIAELRMELEASKKSWEEEKHYLRRKIEELNVPEKQTSSTPQKINSSIQRILTESPAPLPRRKELLTTDLDLKGSPSVAENVMQIMDSDSPYLSSKTNYGAIFGARYCSSLTQKKSIFKPLSATSSSKSSTSPPETIYTGLGGQVKEDHFKFPEKKLQAGLKRTKTSSSISASKFRKLAPLGLKKITDFTT